MGNRLSQKERILLILDDHEWHGRGEFIYTHYLPKHDSRISELISKGAKIEKKVMSGPDGRNEMHYRIPRPEQEQMFIPLSQVNSL